MDNLRDPKVMGALRHLLTSTGPLIASNGWATETQWHIYVGIGMALLGFWASWTAKEKS